MFQSWLIHNAAKWAFSAVSGLRIVCLSWIGDAQEGFEGGGEEDCLEVDWMFGIIAQKLKNIDLPSFEALESELSLIEIQSQALLVTEMTHTSDLKNPRSQIFCSVYRQKREQNSQAIP